jgi:hypothetical protein
MLLAKLDWVMTSSVAESREVGLCVICVIRAWDVDI